MIQAGLVAPNLHFNRLNPRIEPYYQGLKIPTQLSSWPNLPEGVPRRVSINSFGECRLYDSEPFSSLLCDSILA